MMRRGTKPRWRLTTLVGLGLGLTGFLLVRAQSAEALCTVPARSGVQCGIGWDSCEVTLGAETVNYCNSSARGDGLGVLVYGRTIADSPPPVEGEPAGPKGGGEFVTLASSGASAYATLWCSHTNLAFYSGIVKHGEVRRCPETWPYSHPIRIVCGPVTNCQNQTAPSP